MKKAVFLVVFILCFSLNNFLVYGAPAFNKDKLITKSSSFLSSFKKNEFDSFFKNMSPTLTSALKKEEFIAIVKREMLSAGSYKSVIDKHFEIRKDFGCVIITEEYSSHNLVFTFVFNQKNQLEGVFCKALAKRSDVLLKSEPEYTEYQLKVGYKDEKMNGILTLPKNIKKPPVVVLVSGSGPQDMDETIGAAKNKPMRDIAQGLAKKGIATIRFDKRYAVYIPKPEYTTVEDEIIDDAMDALLQAKEDTRLDRSRVFLLGHSFGGMIAPDIAVKDNDSLKGIIILAGSPRYFADIIGSQYTSYFQSAQGIPENEKKLLIKNIFDNIEKIKSVDEKSTGEILGLPANYWFSLNKIYTEKAYLKTTLPMLILQGSNDINISADTDFKEYQNELTGKKGVTFKLYPGLNHLFMAANNKIFSPTVYDSPGKVDETVISDIAEWINKS